MFPHDIDHPARNRSLNRALSACYLSAQPAPPQYFLIWSFTNGIDLPTAGNARLLSRHLSCAQYALHSVRLFVSGLTNTGSQHFFFPSQLTVGSPLRSSRCACS